jgi:hypothetical protein
MAKKSESVTLSSNDCIPVVGILAGHLKKSALALCIVKPVTQLYIPYALPDSENVSACRTDC